MIWGIFTWVSLSLLIGGLGIERKIGFWGAFGMSLIFSPLIGLIFTLASKDIDSEKQKEEALALQKKQIEAIEANGKGSVAGELERLVQLKQQGVLSEEEFGKLKSEIIK